MQKLKKSIFEMSIISQTLNNNLRITRAKSINLQTIGKLIEYYLKNVCLKAIFTLTVLKILLFPDRSVLSPTQWGTGKKGLTF